MRKKFCELFTSERAKIWKRRRVKKPSQEQASRKGTQKSKDCDSTEIEKKTN